MLVSAKDFTGFLAEREISLPEYLTRVIFGDIGLDGMLDYAPSIPIEDGAVLFPRVTTLKDGQRIKTYTLPMPRHALAMHVSDSLTSRIASDKDGNYLIAAETPDAAKGYISELEDTYHTLPYAKVIVAWRMFSKKGMLGLQPVYMKDLVCIVWGRHLRLNLKFTDFGILLEPFHMWSDR